MSFFDDPDNIKQINNPRELFVALKLIHQKCGPISPAVQQALDAADAGVRAADQTVKHFDPETNG